MPPIPIRDKILWLETVRGCATVCVLSLPQAAQKIETFPLDRIEGEVRRAVENGIEELFS